MAEPMVELVQQDVQVYSAPDDVFASFDDDSGARVREWRADCRDVDTDPLKYDVKLRDERRDDTPDRLKEQLKEVKVGNLSSLPILLFVFSLIVHMSSIRFSLCLTFGLRLLLSLLVHSFVCSSRLAYYSTP